jgi:hypothetical protein
VSFRDYKLKAKATDDVYGEQRYDGAWNPSRTYLVLFEIHADRVAMYVDGVKVAEVFVPAPAEVTMGYGWPEGSRPGPLDAVLTDVRWSEQE